MGPDSPGSPPAPTRRAVLRGGAALALAAVGGTALAACSTGPTQRELDAEALVPLARQADAQRRQAEQLAPRETDYTDALKQVATERAEHARALTDEINRLNASSAAAITAAAGEGATSLSLDQLRDALKASARDAADAAVAASGFRAGLLGAVSASCTALKEIQLR